MREFIVTLTHREMAESEQSLRTVLREHGYADTEISIQAIPPSVPKNEMSMDEALDFYGGQCLFSGTEAFLNRPRRGSEHHNYWIYRKMTIEKYRSLAELFRATEKSYGIWNKCVAEAWLVNDSRIVWLKSARNAHPVILDPPTVVSKSVQRRVQTSRVGVGGGGVEYKVRHSPEHLPFVPGTVYSVVSTQYI